MWFKRMLCRFGWHTWTPWDNPRWVESGKAIQYRKCLICNKQERHVF